MQQILKFLLFASYLLLISFGFSRYFANAQVSGQPSGYAQVGDDNYSDPLHTYTVREGDTLLSIALEINVDLNDMYCILAPGFQRTQPLIIGEKLLLPLIDAACHHTDENDSLTTVAQQYNVLISELINMTWNQTAYPVLTELAPDTPLQPGLFLRIPPPYTAIDNTNTDDTNTDDIVAYSLPGLSNAELPTQDFTQDIVNLGELLQRPINGQQRTSQAVPFMAIVVGDNITADKEQKKINIGNGSPTVSVLPESILDEPTLNGSIFSKNDRANIVGPTPNEWPYGSGDFIWPLQGWMTQNYHSHHRAVDIAVPLGTPIVATDRGTVVRAGWNDQGYGLFVIIDHNIGYVTLYAHMSEIWVTEGDVVTQGQFLGAVGSTGNSTGPHLHFELRDFGQRVDPLNFLGQ